LKEPQGFATEKQGHERKLENEKKKNRLHTVRAIRHWVCGDEQM
jgi:hypothetical protein